MPKFGLKEGLQWPDAVKTWRPDEWRLRRPEIPPGAKEGRGKVTYLETALGAVWHDTRVSQPCFRDPKPEREIITKCAGIRFHAYDDSWYRLNVTSLIYNGVLYKIVK
jgi:hypothetical protein